MSNDLTRTDPPLEGTAIPPLPPEHDDMNGYELALRMAGAKVHAFQEFGSWQGDWWALVTLADGRTGWVNGAFGSCSVCDSFQSESGWRDAEKPDYTARLAAFGRGYLDGFMVQQEAEAKAAENIAWDLDAERMVAFVKQGGTGRITA